MNVDVQAVSLLTPAQLLAHWQGHRRLTRKIIEAFPDDQLFSFSAAGMRTFGNIGWEIQGVSSYILSGLMTDQWPKPEWGKPVQQKSVLLAAWDELSAQMDRELPTVPPARYSEEKALMWGKQTALSAALYALDNEIHHRGQGYVYLRLLGLEPPPFWER
jgi:uncharacterized damage-inducible protein DinB